MKTMAAAMMTLFMFMANGATGQTATGLRKPHQLRIRKRSASREASPCRQTKGLPNISLARCRFSSSLSLTIPRAQAAGG